MSLREYLAGKALAGLMAGMNPETAAMWAVKYADALLAELSKS